MDLQDKGVIDNGCSRHMTENMSYLTYYEEIDRGYVAFGGNPKGGKITGKCTIKTVVTNDFSRFTWAFFLATKDETSSILKSFTTGIENLVDHKVKTLGGREGESFWEGGDDFRVDVLRFHTCLTDILGFLEKLEWWFEQDIDKEEERFEGDEDGGEV
ncbi:hypothetical protein Tco_0620876 [Tanacetum coccineum]